MSFNVDRVLACWEENYPDRGERIVVLRGMLYDCETPRKSKSGHPFVYKETAKNLRLMLAAEGASL